MPFSLSGGLSEMGKSIADTALLAQKSVLEQKKDELAAQMAFGREVYQQGAETARAGMLEQGRNARAEADRQAADARAAEANKTRLEAAGISAAASAARTGNDLVEVADPNNPGQTIFVPKSQAAGMHGKPRAPSASDIIVPILQKISKGGPLTQGEKNTLSAYSKQDIEDYLKDDPSLGGPSLWDRIGKYFSDPVQPSNAGAGAKPGSVLPPGVPLGSQYSPSRNMYRDPNGNLYDANGKPVGQDANIGSQ